MLLTDVFGRSFMDDFFDGFFKPGYYSASRIGQIPAMKTDIRELENSYEIELELPGFQKEDLHAELKDGYLTIQAAHKDQEEKKDEAGRYLCQERYLGHYQRSFFVGKDVTQEDVHAAFENGILKLTVPKKEPKVNESRTILIEG